MSAICRISITPRVKGKMHLMLPPGEQSCSAGSSLRSLNEWQLANGMPSPIKNLIEQGSEWAGARVLDVILERQCELVGREGRSIPDAVAVCRLEGGLGIVISEAKNRDSFGRKSITFDDAGASPMHSDEAAIITQLGLQGYRGPSIPNQLLHRASNAISVAQDYGAQHACFIVHSFATHHKGLAAFQRFAAAMGWPGLRLNELSTSSRISGVSLRIGWASQL